MDIINTDAAYYGIEHHVQDIKPAPKPSPFVQRAEKLFEMGYGPIPDKLGSKAPLLRGWSDYYEKPRIPLDIQQLQRQYPQAGLAVACGYNNLLAIDIDTDDEDKQVAIEGLFDVWPIEKKGKRGFTFFVRYVGQPDGRVPSHQYFEKGSDPTKKGPVFVELLGHGRKTTIPPTLHAETGKPYQWQFVDIERTLFNTRIKDLPEFTAEDLARLEAAIKPWLWMGSSWSADEVKNYQPRDKTKSFTDDENKRLKAYAQKAFDERVREVASTGSGSRNHALFAAVCYLGKWVHSGFLDRGALVNAFVQACETNGYVKDDGRGAVHATINSALNLSRNDPLPDLPDRSMPSAIGERPKTNTNAEIGCNNQNTNFLDEPLPLYRETPNGEPFPVDALGPTLGGMAKALHEAAVQSPMAICATSVLAAASLATQGLRDIVLPIADGKAKPLSLYCLAVAQSGERKSATDDLALAPVKERAKELQRDYDAKITSHCNAHDVWIEQKQRILKNRKLDGSKQKFELDALGAEPKSPKIPIITLGEPTIEGLTKHLKQGYPSVGLFSSEGGQFIGGHAMSDDAKRRSAAALNVLWDEGRLERVRVSEEAVILSGRRISVFLQAQPDVAHVFLSDPILRDMGLLARFLITQPNSTMGCRPFRELTEEHKIAIATYNEKMLQILQRDLPYAEDGNALAPHSLEMSPETCTRWIAFTNHIEGLLKPDGVFNEISGFANKLPEHAARIAAVLAVFDNPDVKILCDSYLERGIDIAQFYAGEALRLYNASRVSAELHSAQSLLNWLQTGWSEPNFTVRVITRLGPNSIRDKTTAERLTAILETHGWVSRADGVIVEGKMARTAWRIYGKS